MHYDLLCEQMKALAKEEKWFVPLLANAAALLYDRADRIARFRISLILMLSLTSSSVIFEVNKGEIESRTTFSSKRSKDSMKPPFSELM